MNGLLSAAGIILVFFALSSCALEQEMATPPAKPATPAVAEAKKAPTPATGEAKKAAPEKAKETKETKVKPVKAKGDVGLLDLEKNYMILVTKEGKLITVDFNDKTKVTKIVPTPSKVEDIGLGSSATAEYQSKGGKKTTTKIEYKAAKGGE